MRFIDASTFVYAFLKPKRPLPPEAEEMKRKAQNILRRINKGENVTTSVVHVSEVANILEARAGLSECRKIVSDIITKKSVDVADVNSEMYIASIQTAEMYDVGINDALAFCIMRKRNLEEIYSFDKHFDNMPEIKRATK